MNIRKLEDLTKEELIELVKLERESPVRTTAGQLTKAMMREAGERIKAKKDSE